MKKLLLSLTTVLALNTQYANAQINIPNPNFEVWTHTSVGTFNPVAYDDPNSSTTIPGWQDFNVTSATLLGGSPVSVFKDSTNQLSGKYCALIKTVKLASGTVTTIGASNLPNDTLGLIMLASLSGTKIVYGIPFSRVLSGYHFYYKYAPIGTDTGFCKMTFTKHRSNGSHTVAHAYYIVPSATSTWTEANMTTVIDSVSVIPDTLIIIFSSSSIYKPQIGSQFWIDSASDPEGVPQMFEKSSNVNIYPNPANTSVNFQISGEQAEKVEIYDVTGKLVNTCYFHNNFLSLNTQTYNSGIYFYKLFDNNGTPLSAGKFTIQH